MRNFLVQNLQHRWNGYEKGYNIGPLKLWSKNPAKDCPSKFGGKQSILLVLCLQRNLLEQSLVSQNTEIHVRDHP